MEGSVELKTVGELFNMKFCIPSYQRGYRWRVVHVETLLKDLEIFKDCKKGFYSLQPLVVVKKDENGQEENTIDISSATTYAEAEAKLRNAWLKSRTWDVIDGQQRLTTLFLILKYLKKCVQEGGSSALYKISYDTRDQSARFLESIDTKTEDDLKQNIDFARMGEVYGAIGKWFEDKNDDYKKNFWDCICNHVQFIWYESQGERDIEVFTRLNMGTIKLTDAELIKALLLNRDLFSEKGEQLEFVRKKIATEWDDIERRLQDDAFWYFLQPGGLPKKESPTRIDFILELTRKQLEIDWNDRLFLSYEKYFAKQEVKADARKKVWDSVLEIYRTLEEWFDDSELYHYTGYLMVINKCVIENKSVVEALIDEWKKCEKNGGREEFLCFLKKQVRDSLNEIAKKGEIKQYENSVNPDTFLTGLLNIKYKDVRVKQGEAVGNVKQNENDKRPDKTVCRPILLLHNILTVLKIGKGEEENAKYKGQKAFYKFPFNLYNNENWDVEHIASQTDNNLSNDRERKEWLLSAWQYIADEDLKSKIRDFIGKKEDRLNFGDLAGMCENDVRQDRSSAVASDDDKNTIGNFVLLDAGTNRSYKNALFPVKRRTIMKKEQGQKLDNLDLENDKLKFEWTHAKSPFVPLCTKNVFLQYYTELGASPLFWSTSDAKAYRNNIRDLLKEFVFQENKSDLEKKLEDIDNEQ